MNRVRSVLERRRDQRARLPWRELEAEAARQGVSAADIFFDRAGRVLPVLPAARTNPLPASVSHWAAHPPRSKRSTIEPRSNRV